MTDILVNTGEYRPPRLRELARVALRRVSAARKPVHLRDPALSTSAPLGTVFDAEGKVGHILLAHLA